MRKPILLSLAIALCYTSLGQPSVNTTSNPKPKDSLASLYYLPANSLKDSINRSQTLQKLAVQVCEQYAKNEINQMEPEARSSYYDTAIALELAAGHYKNTLSKIDSFRKYPPRDSGNRAYYIDYETYAQTLNKSGHYPTNFNELYSQQFREALNGLATTREKIYADFIFDSTRITNDSTNIHNSLESLITRNTDSLSYSNALRLSFLYGDYLVAKATTPLARQIINHSEYHLLYPLIRLKDAAVAPVQNIDAFTDPDTKYKLLMEMFSGIKNKPDSANIYSIHEGLVEAGRKINLHLIAGVKMHDLDVVMVIHGPALRSFYNNETYRKKYKIDNPNISLIRQLQSAGVKIIACGQSMFYYKIKKEEFLPGVQVALSAQTALSTYQLKNYVLYYL
jgi:intracellular sulfur oxidation DsrE/DsrF family protein